VGIAERAAARRPPLAAAAYIYESITHPTAYIVEGFSGAMPQNYPERLSERELGDIIAYLLTPDAH
jgi:mono/diheme cytochrome c family protein